MRGSDEITNNQDIIDSREIIARIEYLQSEKEGLEDNESEAREALEEAKATEDDKELASLQDALQDAENAVVTWAESDEGRELKALLALQDEAEGYSEDWRHGATLIRDTYFTEYAEEFASDITDYNPNKVHWPFTCIDWEKAANKLKQDYTSVDFDGVEYWVR
jgi:hypothetical protein